MNEKEVRLSIQELIDELLKYPESDREAIMSEVLGPVECVPIYAAVIPDVAVAYGVPYSTMGTEPNTPAPIDVISNMEYLNRLKMESDYKDIRMMIYRLKSGLTKIGEKFRYRLLGEIMKIIGKIYGYVNDKTR